MNIVNESNGVRKLFLSYFKNQLDESSKSISSSVDLEKDSFLSDVLRFSELVPVNVYIVYFEKNYPIEYTPDNVTFVELRNDKTLPNNYGKKDKNCIAIYCSGESHNVDFWDYNKQAWLRSRIEPLQSIIINTKKFYF